MAGFAGIHDADGPGRPVDHRGVPTASPPRRIGAQLERLAVGAYVLPVDATDTVDSFDHTHAGEGVVWAFTARPDPDTGELVDLALVVRTFHGRLQWGQVPVDRIGSITPANRANISSLLKGLGKELTRAGAGIDDRSRSTLVELLRAAS